MITSRTDTIAPELRERLMRLAQGAGFEGLRETCVNAVSEEDKQLYPEWKWHRLGDTWHMHAACKRCEGTGWRLTEHPATAVLALEAGIKGGFILYYLPHLVQHYYWVGGDIKYHFDPASVASRLAAALACAEAAMG